MVAHSKRPSWNLIAVYTFLGVVAFGATHYFIPAKKSVNLHPSVTTNPTVVEAQKRGDEVSVFLTPSGFIPSELTVKTGTKVIWLNKSGVTGNVSSAPHPVHTSFLPLNIGDFDSGESVSLTFKTPGTHKYHNHLNSSQTASVTVK